MRIVSVRLRNFRCFQSLDLEFESPVVLIHGPNGSGKTSILEALHYACYLKSFKTHLPRDIVRSETDGFGVGLSVVTQSFDNLQVQFNRKKKSVKLNEQGVNSYKELYDAYRVITITEADLMMIQGAPSARRSFLDTLVLLKDPDHAARAKKYRAILDNRNALIARGRIDHESYMLWTEQLLTVSCAMQKARKVAVAELEKEAQLLIEQVLPIPEGHEQPVTLTYTYSRPYSGLEGITSAQELIERYPGLKDNEYRQKRTLFGAHLDDFGVTYLGKSCRTYSSRGQQKLVVFLLKMAQVKSMQSHGVILLVDDFMTDFDEERASLLLSMMTKLSSQVILTSPIESLVKNKLSAEITQSIDLSTLSPTKSKLASR